MPLVFLPQILWHSKDNKQCDRVYSLDFQPQPPQVNEGGTREFNLATGGADEFVHIWRVSIHDHAPQYATHSSKSILAPENLRVNAATGQARSSNERQPFTVKILARLVGHIGEVNAVRWNPNGIILASGGEDRCIFLWSKAEGTRNQLDGSGQEYEEHYTRFQYYRLSHVVNTINWCPNGRLLAVTTEDGHVSLIDTFIDGPGKIRHFEGHTSFAQGVVICPKNMMVASMGQDQTLRIWKRRNEKQWKNILVLRSAKDRSEFKESIGMESDDVRYSRSVFMNEELSTFFRRLDWSPDGRFLVTPAGIRHNALFKKEEEPDTKSEPVYTLYVFHRKLIHLGIPMVTHQSPTGPFVVVKFCPLDIAKIQRDKIDFFSKLFSKGKNAKKKKTTPKKANSTSSAASSAKTTKKITEMCAAGGKASSEVREEAVGRQSVSNEETPVRLQDEQDVKEASETSVYSATAAETSTAAFANEGPAEDSSHVTVKPESSSPSQSSPNRVDDGGVQTREQSDESVSTKLEEVSTSAGLELNINNEQLEVPELDLLQTMDSVAIDCSAPTDRQEEAEGDDNGAECVPVRSSKRESRPPKYYEATLHETGATRKSSKPKSAKKDEDQEYDTDVEDEVVVPRLLFAAGTLDGSLCFYDTMENKGPVAVLKNLHYCTITDIAWSPDGFVCATASSDGYITFVVFQRKEFY